MALAETRFVAAQHHGNMPVSGQGYIEGLVDQHLLGGVHDMIVAPYNGVDVHGDVVDDHHEVVCGRAVAAADDEVVQLVVLEHDVALDHIL